MTLQPKNWIDAAWLQMANKGLEAVKVEVLARQLKVSKGSFYWHFKNRNELLEAVLQRWEQQTKWLIETSQQEPNAKEKLIKLFKLVEQVCQEPDPEPAIFLWAKKDTSVLQRVHALEVKRVSYAAQLLEEYGFNALEARRRAEVAYLALMGFAERQERDRQFALDMGEFNDFLLSLLLAPPNISFRED